MNKNLKYVIPIILLLITILFYFFNLPSKEISEYKILEKNNNLYLEIVEKKPKFITYKIYNNTNETYYYGVDYEIEQFINDAWYSNKINNTWIDIAVTLKNNSINEEKIDITKTYGKLSKGKYRLIKKINNQILYDEFEIK